MTKSIGIFFILMVIASAAAGCASSPASSPDNISAAGSQKITISGAFALYPMMVKWAEEYQKIHKDVRIEVSAGGAGKGMTDALTGMVDLGMVSRDISPQEIEKGAVYVAVTKDAVVVTGNAGNPAFSSLQKHGINKSMLRQIFVNETVTDWGVVVHQPQFHEKINVYSRSDACGAADIWAKYLGYKQEDLRGTGVFGDPGLADAVKTDRLGIGYNNIGFAYDAVTGRPLDGLAIIPLDLNDNGTIDPDEAFYATRDEITSAIDTGKYPSPPARELNLVVKGNFTGPSKEFVHWILTDGQQYVPESGYIPLTGEKIQQELNKVPAGKPLP